MLRQLAMIALVVAGTAGLPLASLAAQPPSRPVVGQRVRVHLGSNAVRLEGTVAGWAADTLLLRQLVFKGSPDSLVHIPRTNIMSYQTSLGRDEGRGARRGARTGALIGGGVGLTLLTLGILSDSGCEEYCLGTLFGAVLGAGTTLGGFILGATLGVLTAPERWSDAQSVTLHRYRSPSQQLALVLSISG